MSGRWQKRTAVRDDLPELRRLKRLAQQPGSRSQQGSLCRCTVDSDVRATSAEHDHARRGDEKAPARGRSS